MINLSQHLSSDAAAFGATSLTKIAREMQGSLILGIGAEVRALAASGVPVCNLTVGDFDPKQFPIPQELRDATVAAMDGFQTNYPPSEGILELRKAVCAWYERELGLTFSPDWVVVASGARPVMYATYRLFLEPGDTLLFAVPSWNNGYYGQLTDANAIALVTRAEDDFFPTVELLAPHIRTARLFTLNSPLNPTGTVIPPERLAALARAIVAENARRAPLGEKPLLWMWDQVYWRLTFGAASHAHPAALVPEVTPYVITIDAISKAFAATGLRVGWAVLPPILAERMKAFIGHVGAWAPKPEQVGTAALLDNDAAMARFGESFRAALAERLGILDAGLTRLGVQHLVPQGAIYLSVCFDALLGRPGLDGVPMTTNEDIRRFLLHRAGVAVVPFQAFDLAGESGWFRMSVGAVSPAQLHAALDRLATALG
ncbi:MAG: aminotransferase class I/II-fold pyridoxal phosphate-dependent enzyme [Pseudomonadota bacterium]|nr:aminotransferase class I/II-fold pyridoxal phosphate-dependent enzyme [Pseudomonadota bacterium]